MADVKKVMVLVFPGKSAFRPLCPVDGLLPSVCRRFGIVQCRRLVFQSLDEVMCEQMGKGQVEVDAFDTFFSDPDLFEECLVVGASYGVGGPRVGLHAIGGEGEGLFQIAFNLTEPMGTGVKDTLCLGFLFGNPCLFFFEEFDGDRIGVVGVEGFLAFVAELAESTCLPVDLFAVEASSDLDVVGHVLADLVDTTRSKRDDFVVVNDLVFDLVEGQVRLGAAVSTLPAEAVGVWVGSAVAIGIDDRKTRAAGGAEDASF